MTTRTYGTYRWAPGLGTDRARWILDLEPAVRMRARRTFGRAQQTRTMAIELYDTTEVCRDIAWFSSRYPLKPADRTAKERLTAGTRAHKEQEIAIERALSGRATELDLEQLDHTPAKTPRDYQNTAQALLRARGRLLLADEVGLGKTFTGLLGAMHADALPMLIVPPTHLPRRWVTEVLEAFPWLSYMVAQKTTPPAAIVAGQIPDVLIVPYSKLDGWAGYLQGQMASVIFDEVQDLKHGVSTTKGAAAALVTSTANFAMGLSATPINGYGGEIWNIYDILAPGELGSREEFIREWGHSQGANVIVDDPAALGAYLREQGLLLARTRKDVGRELPKTIKTHHLVDTDYKALAAVEEAAKDLAHRILSDDATPQEKMQAAGEIDWKLRHATGVDKAPYVADFVAMLLESEEKVVIWGWHRDVYDIWMERLARFNPRLYTGSETAKQKADAEDAFTKPRTPEDEPGRADDCRILIMSLRSGAGVDGLQKVARVGVFGELDWSPAVHEQAIGRLRRDGMGDDPPVAYYLTSAEGSDPSLLDILQVKRQQQEPIISPDGKLLANAVSEAGRGKRLAQHILGLTEKDAQ